MEMWVIGNGCMRASEKVKDTDLGKKSSCNSTLTNWIQLQIFSLFLPFKTVGILPESHLQSSKRRANTRCNPQNLFNSCFPHSKALLSRASVFTIKLQNASHYNNGSVSLIAEPFSWFCLTYNKDVNLCIYCTRVIPMNTNILARSHRPNFPCRSIALIIQMYPARCSLDLSSA